MVQADKGMARRFARRAILHTRYKAICLPSVKTSLQQNPAVHNWMCWLRCVVLYNGCKMCVVVRHAEVQVKQQKTEVLAVHVRKCISI